MNDRDSAVVREIKRVMRAGRGGLTLREAIARHLREQFASGALRLADDTDGARRDLARLLDQHLPAKLKAS